MIGRHIEQYRVLEKVGSGGMGSVYKAHDTKLDRAVALKFLHLDRSDDEGSKDRFIREAKAASALDHPNICTIYDISDTDEGQLYIVMAHYEGETLKSRINRGPLTAGEALSISSQLAEGLRAAHKEGIVHRDIKPANILVTTEGTIKILDFGLAKVADSQITRTGSTVGTTAYMSPEQLRGEPVDHHADIWSLGVVLYEMLTGHRPFEGDYPQAVIYSILNQSRPSIQTHSQQLRAEVKPLMDKLLAKNPAKRYENIDLVLVDLMIIIKRLSDQTLGTGISALRMYPFRTIATAVLGTAAIVTVSYFFFVWLGLIGVVGESTIRVEDEEVLTITRKSGFAEAPAISWDGEKVSYSEAGNGFMDIKIEPVRGGVETTITSSDRYYGNPSWSPTPTKITYSASGLGIRVGYADSNSDDYGVSEFGSHPKWSPNADSILFDSGGSIYVVSGDPPLGGMHPRLVVEGTSNKNTYARWSADASHIIYWDRTRHDIFVLNMSTGNPTGMGLIRAPNEVGGLSLSPQGDLFYSQGTFGGRQVLWHLSVDPNTLEPRSKPKRLTTSQSDFAKCDVSRVDEVLVCMQRVIDRDLYEFFLTDTGTLGTHEPGDPISRGSKSEYPAYSRDGKHLVWTSHDEGDGQLEAYDFESEHHSSVTRHEEVQSREAAASFSKEGWIAFASTQDSVYALKYVQGYEVNTPLPLTESPESNAKDLGPNWSPVEDEWVFFSTRHGSYDIWFGNMETPSEPRNLTPWDESSEMYPSWTPDGQRIVFVSDRNGVYDIWIADKDGGDAMVLIDEPGEKAWPVWHPSENRLYFASDRNGAFNIWMKDFDSGDLVQITDYPDVQFGLPERSMLTKFAVTTDRITIPLEYREAFLVVVDFFRD